MNRILAVEPDADRGALLRHLVQESLNTDVVLATSADDAIAAMTVEPPDLILMSVLLTATEDQRLLAHLRATPSLGHLPVLTVPVVFEAPTTPARSRGLISRLLRRRAPEAWPSYDFTAVVARIEEALTESRIAAARRADDDSLATASIENDGLLPVTSALFSSGFRKRAPRLSVSDVPWVSSVTLSLCQHLRLLNISSSGMLVESGARLSRGCATIVTIDGIRLALVVPARVVRYRIATVDALGVKYETAVAFDRPVEALIADADDPADASTQIDDLVALVRKLAACGVSPAQLRSEFEAGLLDLIAAGEIRLRDLPAVEGNGRESVYFTIPTADGTRAVLQVTFNPNDEPRAADFAVLTDAVQAAATVLPLTGTTSHGSANPQMPGAAATRLLEPQFA
jgi:hypothetical protein